MPIAKVIVPALVCLWVFWNLHYEWSLNPQYNYGWAVPVLAAFLFWQRWQTRPIPSVPTASIGHRLLIASMLFLLLPVRLIEEANPDWRLVSWTLALIGVASALLALEAVGGRRWARHFAFPVCFLLVAVPWPVQFENFVVQTLTSWVASAAVEIVGWIGIGAYQLGNIIQLRNGLVGVDEACSGVRTLQSAIMVTLFLGELLRLSGRRRILYLIVGCAWVFACNIVRATTLVIIAGTHGLETLARWHDFVGSALLIGGIAGLAGAAFAFSRRQKPVELTAAAAQGHHEVGSVGPLLPVIWLAAVFAGSELWYRRHERELVQRPVWAFRLPENLHARLLPIADSTAEILHYSRASSAAWQTEGGTVWWAFFARWNPRRAALQLVRSHSPEICLPAVGRTFRGPLPGFTYTRAKLQLPFTASEFEENGKPLFVFVCIQADKASRSSIDGERSELTIASRLRATLRGERNLGQRLLEFAVSGSPDYRSAKDELLRTVGETVRLDATD